MRGRPGGLPQDRPSSVVEREFVPPDGCPRDVSLGTSPARGRRDEAAPPCPALGSSALAQARRAAGGVRSTPRPATAAAGTAGSGPACAQLLLKDQAAPAEETPEARERAPGPVPPLGAASWSRPPKSFLLPPANGRRRPSAPAPRLRTAE